MEVTTLAGTGHLRGTDYGHILGRRVGETAAALKQQLAAAGHAPGPLGRRLATGPLAQAAADLTPDMWAETRALARASGLDLEDVLLLTFLDEVWGLTRHTGCSVVGRVVEGRPGSAERAPLPPTTELGQTMDLPAWSAGRATVLRIVPGDAPVVLALAYPGSPGLCGANDAGLAVAVNALPMPAIDEGGLGVAYVTRHVLSLDSVAAAESFLASVPLAAGQAYSIAARDGLATFETGPGLMRRSTPPGEPAIAHTNHVLGRGMVPSRPPTESSRRRLDLLVAGLQRHAPIAAVLRDVTVDGERWRDRHVTFGAFRATGSEGFVRFIDGDSLRGGRREWSRVSFS